MIPGAPPWLERALRLLPSPICKGCGCAILGSSKSRKRCECHDDVARATLERFLPEVPLEGDGPHVTWTPELPKDVDIRADGQGGVAFYRRSKTTKRFLPVHRIPPWTEGT